MSAVLESAGRGLPADGEVIVVDGDPDRSGEGVVRDIQSRFGDLTVHYVASAPCAALQRNVGIDTASGDVVVFLDDDCTFEPGMVEALLSAYEDREVVGATGRIDQPPRERVAENPHSRLRWLLLGGARGDRHGLRFSPPDSRHGAGARCRVHARPVDVGSTRGGERGALRRATTAYSLGEDDDFSYRVSRHGRVRYEPSALVYHHELGWRSIDRRKMDRLQVVNRSYLFRKNFCRPSARRLGSVG